MNKTLLDFTATALLSTLLTHPFTVVAVGGGQHDSARYCERASVLVLQGSGQVRQMCDGLETENALQTVAQGVTNVTALLDRANLANAHSIAAPSTSVIVQEGGAERKPLLEGSDQSSMALSSHISVGMGSLESVASGHRSNLSHHSSLHLGEKKEGRVGSTGDPMEESNPEDKSGKCLKISAYTLLGAGVLSFLLWLASKGNGNVTDVSMAGMPAFEPPLWRPEVKSIGAPSDGDAGEDGSEVGVESSSEKPSGSNVEPSTEDPTFGISASDAPEWVKNVVTSTEDSGFEEESSSSSSAGDTTAQESTKTTTTTTTTTTSTTTEQPTTTKEFTPTTVPPIVTEPRSGYKPYDEVWVEYCDQNTNWQPMQDEMQYWIWHHEQQAQTPYALNDCSAQYTNDGVFFLSVPDHYVYVCYPDGSSFFHYPQNNVWIPVHPS